MQDYFLAAFDEQWGRNLIVVSARQLLTYDHGPQNRARLPHSFLHQEHPLQLRNHERQPWTDGHHSLTCAELSYDCSYQIHMRQYLLHGHCHWHSPHRQGRRWCFAYSALSRSFITDGLCSALECMLQFTHGTTESNKHKRSSQSSIVPLAHSQAAHCPLRIEAPHSLRTHNSQHSQYHESPVGRAFKSLTESVADSPSYHQPFPDCLPLDHSSEDQYDCCNSHNAPFFTTRQ